MKTNKLGRGLATLTAVPATLSTPEAAAQDHTGAALCLEQSRDGLDKTEVEHAIGLVEDKDSVSPRRAARLSR
jgi:hypothetical protein